MKNKLESLGLGNSPKRSNGADCKSAGYAFTGSNPVLPTIFPKESKGSLSSPHFTPTKSGGLVYAAMFKGHQAKVYDRRPCRPCYRITWRQGGQRIFRERTRFTSARQVAEDAVRQLAAGNCTRVSFPARTRRP